MARHGQLYNCFSENLSTLRFGRNLPVILGLICLIFSSQISAQLDISNQTDSYTISHEMRWLEDKSRTYEINSVLTPSVDLQFKPLKKKRFNQGYSDSNYWFHLPIYYVQQDTEKPDKQWILEIDYPLLESLDVYIKRQDQSIEHIQLGTRVAFAERPLQYKNFLIPVDIQPGETFDIYMKLHTSSSVRMLATLHSSTGLLEDKILTMTGYGLFFGTMIAMICYNFFIYLSLKEKSYLLYIGYIISFTFLQIAISGYGFQYLWPETPWFNTHAITFLMLVCSFLALRFCLAFLSLAKNAPKITRTINFASVGCLSALALTLILPYALMIKYSIATTLLTNVFIIFAGIWALKNGNYTARFFLLAWACLLIGVSIQALMVIHIVPDNVFTANASAIGVSFEVILLSLALGDRINQNQKDNQHLEQVSQQRMQQAHEELRKSLSKEEQNNRLKDQFLATISHELRTPMNGVEGALELLNPEKFNKKQLNYIEAAKHSARDMTELIEAILRFSEIQSGALTIKPSPFELRSVFHPAALKFRKDCHNKGLEFHWHIDKELPNYILADQEQLLLIINQLTDNAIKFTSKGYVTVNIWQDEFEGNPELVFSVSDTGEGIPTDQLDNIFHGFHQLDGRDNRRHTGLGIGLAICHQLSLIMNGRLHVESVVNKGTNISLHLPLVASREQEQMITTESAPSVGKKNVVLIAEDNPVNQMVLRSMLEKLGCIVLTADNGQEAIRVLDQQPVDLIMMDCQMPTVDGFEATRLIRASKALYNDIPIIAVTANAMTGDSTRCIAAGMNDYIKKPINRDVLESKTARWLNHNALPQ